MSSYFLYYCFKIIIVKISYYLFLLFIMQIFQNNSCQQFNSIYKNYSVSTFLRDIVYLQLLEMLFFSNKQLLLCVSSWCFFCLLFTVSQELLSRVLLFKNNYSIYTFFYQWVFTTFLLCIAAYNANVPRKLLSNVPNLFNKLTMSVL